LGTALADAVPWPSCLRSLATQRRRHHPLGELRYAVLPRDVHSASDARVSHMPERERGRVLAAARQAVRDVVDDPLARRARVNDPIPVCSPSGELDSWFIPLTAEQRLLGFLQLEPDLRLHRYSSFQRTPGSSEGC